MLPACSLEDGPASSFSCGLIRPLDTVAEYGHAVYVTSHDLIKYA